MKGFAPSSKARTGCRRGARGQSKHMALLQRQLGWIVAVQVPRRHSSPGVFIFSSCVLTFNSIHILRAGNGLTTVRPALS